MSLKEFYYFSKKEGACYATHGHWGEHQLWSRGRREREAWLRTFIMFVVEKARQGDSLEVTSLSNVSSKVQGWPLVV